MEYQNYQQIMQQVKSAGQVNLSVAAAEDIEVLQAVKLAYEAGIAKAILVGEERRIRPMLQEVGLPADIRIVDELDPAQAALRAVSLVKDGEAQVLMKGLVNSSDFLKAVLHPSEGLRTGRLLSHLAVFEIPGQSKLLFVTDGGMNIAPLLQEKKEILINSLLAMHSIGINRPNVAVLTANEVVSDKMPATLDARTLVEMSLSDELPACLMEGPIALDVAISPAAAAHKGINSKISGKVDLILVPNIETGNAVGKSLVYFAGGKMAGIVLGAAAPIVMTSRSDSAEDKLHSIALACLMNGGCGQLQLSPAV